MAGNQTVEFRVVERRVNGSTVESWWEYRTREVLISLAIVNLSQWSAWQKVDTVRVDQSGNVLT
jgi:hypothetical protein